MNAADTRCGPAFTAIGGVWRFMPVGSASLIRGLMSRSATRAPLIDTSSCSPRAVLPYSWPVGIEWSIIRNVVFAVGGEVVDDGDAAARAERRALDVRELRRRARHW